MADARNEQDMSKRKREDLGPHKAVLLQYFSKGMRNCSTEQGKALVTECSEKTGLLKLTVKNWIHNENLRCRRLGKPKPPRVKAPSLHPRKKSGKSVFLSEHMKSDKSYSDSKDRMRRANQAYALLSTEAKSALAAEARLLQETPVQRSAEEQDRLNHLAKAQHRQEIDRLIGELQALGEDSILVTCSDSGVLPSGSRRGRQYLDSHPGVATGFYTFITGKEHQVADGEKVLRQRVTSLFNQLAAQQLGVNRMPYKRVAKGDITAQGLPEGIALKTPGQYGRLQMEQILAASTSITLKVGVEDNLPADTAEGQFDMDAETAVSIIAGLVSEEEHRL